MDAMPRRSPAWIFIVSALALAAGCASGGGGDDSYRNVPLVEKADPLAPRKDFPAWKPPRQFAVWIQPHEDRTLRTLVGGHWMMMLLSEGSWYVDDEVDREPVPDAEASAEDIRSGTGILVPQDAIVPYREKGN